MKKPSVHPTNPCFSSGPTAKRPGWSPAVLEGAFVGRSHRAPVGKASLNLVLQKTKALLQLPSDYEIAIIPGSDTGAFECALWSMLGARGVEVLAWDSFGKLWLTDCLDHLKLADCRKHEAAFGALPDLSTIDFDRDVVFTWNGTSSGVRVPDANWISATRKGLTIVDATSAVFAQHIDWSKIDCATFSWQKALGGEAAHGMMVLSPRAIERLETSTPPRPLPKLFRLTKNGKMDRALFEGHTINTPSMLCVGDFIDALSWAESIGGLAQLQRRTDQNAKVLFDWLDRTPWVENLARDPTTRSNTSVCLKIIDPAFTALTLSAQRAFTDAMVKRLGLEFAAFDIGAYRDAPPGLRIWCGPTVETSDLKALTPWLDWAFELERGALGT
jgi:phosphoserine aminotransferase